MNNEVKNVPELRFPEFSGEWKEKELGQCTNLITKGTTPKDKSGKGTINYIKVENIYNGKINPRMKININEHEGYLKRSKLEANDILFSIAGTLGRTAVVNKSHLPANTNQALAIIRGYEFETNFLITTLGGHAVAKYIRKNPTVGAQPNLSLNQVSKLIINTPSKNEQQKIGDFFSKLDQQIELEEQKLAKLEEQKKGYMQKIFSQELRFKDENGNDYPEWEIKKLMQIAKVKTGSKNVQDNIQDGKFKFFDRSVEVKYLNTFDFDETAIIYPGEGSKFLPRYFSGKYSLHQRAYSIYDININNNYLYYYLSLQNNHFLKYAVGSTVKSLRMSGFDKLKVMVPKNSEQEKIGDFFNELDELIEKQSSKIGVLKQRKKGFLQKMFV